MDKPRVEVSSQEALDWVKRRQDGLVASEVLRLVRTGVKFDEYRALRTPREVAAYKDGELNALRWAEVTIRGIREQVELQKDWPSQIDGIALPELEEDPHA